jgi:hypothetical protein
LRLIDPGDTPPVFISELIPMTRELFLSGPFFFASPRISDEKLTAFVELEAAIRAWTNWLD